MRQQDRDRVLKCFYDSRDYAVASRDIAAELALDHELVVDACVEMDRIYSTSGKDYLDGDHVPQFIGGPSYIGRITQSGVVYVDALDSGID